MAERRMFHTAVVESDAFLDLPVGAQALYFHLGMLADDDGFVNGPRQVARTLHLSTEELDLLEGSGFILNFDGIVVIKHWRFANSWKSDRLQLPRYPEIAEKIFLVDEKIYEKEQIRGAKNLLQIKKKLIRCYGIQMDSKKKREEKKEEEKKRKKKRINEKKIEEKNAPAAAAPGCGDGAVPEKPVDANGPAGENVRRNYDDTYVVLHTFGQDLVHLTKAQIQGLRRIMGEVSLDIYAHRLAKLIREKGDPGNHYETIKNWYLERCGENDQSLYAL